MLLFQSLFFFAPAEPANRSPDTELSHPKEGNLVLQEHSHSLCYTQGPQQSPANATARPAPVLSSASFSRANVQRPCALQTASCQWLFQGLLLPRWLSRAHTTLSITTSPMHSSSAPSSPCLSYTQFVSGAALPYPRSAANPLPARPQ